MGKQRESALWFLLPIFLGWLGGVLGYFIVKGKDESRANWIFLTGLGVTVVVIGIYYGIYQAIDASIIGSPFSLLT